MYCIFMKYGQPTVAEPMGEISPLILIKNDTVLCKLRPKTLMMNHRKTWIKIKGNRVENGRKKEYVGSISQKLQSSLNSTPHTRPVWHAFESLWLSKKPGRLFILKSQRETISEASINPSMLSSKMARTVCFLSWKKSHFPRVYFSGTTFHNFWKPFLYPHSKGSDFIVPSFLWDNFNRKYTVQSRQESTLKYRSQEKRRTAGATVSSTQGKSQRYYRATTELYGRSSGDDATTQVYAATTAASDEMAVTRQQQPSTTIKSKTTPKATSSHPADHWSCCAQCVCNYCDSCHQCYCSQPPANQDILRTLSLDRRSRHFVPHQRFEIHRVASSFIQMGTLYCSVGSCSFPYTTSKCPMGVPYCHTLCFSY